MPTLKGTDKPTVIAGTSPCIYQSRASHSCTHRPVIENPRRPLPLVRSHVRLFCFTCHFCSSSLVRFPLIFFPHHQSTGSHSLYPVYSPHFFPPSSDHQPSPSLARAACPCPAPRPLERWFSSRSTVRHSRTPYFEHQSNISFFASTLYYSIVYRHFSSPSAPNSLYIIHLPA